jgi:hypothetical protein
MHDGESDLRHLDVPRRFVAGPNPTLEGLLDNLGDAKVGFELDRVVDSPAVTQLRYRIVK